MKFIVWVREDHRWVEQGDGPLTLKTANRISKEIQQDCGVKATVRPLGLNPNGKPLVDVLK